MIDDGQHSRDATLLTMHSLAPWHLTDEFVYFVEDNETVHIDIRRAFPQYDIWNYFRITIMSEKVQKMQEEPSKIAFIDIDCTIGDGYKRVKRLQTPEAYGQPEEILLTEKNCSSDSAALTTGSMFGSATTIRSTGLSRSSRSSERPAADWGSSWATPALGFSDPATKWNRRTGTQSWRSTPGELSSQRSRLFDG